MAALKIGAMLVRLTSKVMSERYEREERTFDRFNVTAVQPRGKTILKVGKLVRHRPFSGGSRRASRGHEPSLVTVTFEDP